MTYRVSAQGGTFFSPDDIRPATASHQGLMSKADFAKLATLARPVLRLGYVAAVDLLNGAAIAANTQTQLVANQSFTVGSATAWLQIEVRVGFVCSAVVAQSQIALRANFDTGGLTVLLHTGVTGAAGGLGALNGATLFLAPATLAAGAHTIKLEVIGNNALTGFCRPATQPVFEFAAIGVVELSA